MNPQMQENLFALISEHSDRDLTHWKEFYLSIPLDSSLISESREAE